MNTAEKLRKEIEDITNKTYSLYQVNEMENMRKRLEEDDIKHLIKMAKRTTELKFYLKALDDVEKGIDKIDFNERFIGFEISEKVLFEIKLHIKDEIIKELRK